RTFCAVVDGGNVYADVASGRIVTGPSGTATAAAAATATPTSASAPAPDLRPEAQKLHGPSRAQGVCVQPAMDGRRPALGGGRGQAGGAHPLCAGRAARTTTEMHGTGSADRNGGPVATTGPRRNNWPRAVVDRGCSRSHRVGRRRSHGIGARAGCGPRLGEEPKKRAPRGRPFSCTRGHVRRRLSSGSAPA